MACPINSQAVLMDGGGVRTTAFMQVMASDLHEKTGDEAPDSYSLKSLIDGILKHHPDHQIFVFQITLDSKLEQNIQGDLSVGFKHPSLPHQESHR